MQFFADVEDKKTAAAKEGAKAVPGPGVAIAIGDAFFDSVIQRQVAKNRQELLKCLKSASSDITLTNVSDEEFIMDYVNLQNVTDRLRSNEKIQIILNTILIQLETIESSYKKYGCTCFRTA